MREEGIIIDLKVYDISIMPLVMFLTKVVLYTGIPKKLGPLISVIFGIAAGILYFSPDNILKGVLIGVFIASSAVGFYSGSKNVYEEIHMRYLNKKEEAPNGFLFIL